MTQRRVVNFRPLLFLTAALMAGIFACLFFLRNFSYFIWALATLAGMCLTAMLFKQKFTALTVLFFMLGFSLHYIQHSNLVKLFDENQSYVMEGKIQKISDDKDGYNIILGDLKADGFAAGGKAVLRIEDEHPYKLYDRVKFLASVKNIQLDLSRSSSLAYYGSKVFYKASLLQIISVSPSKLTFFEKLKLGMTSPMFEYLTPENAGVAQSLLTGDVSALDSQDLEAVRESGLSHIFAVSGLHISFVVMIITFLLKKLNTNPWINLAVVTTALFIYCGVTGFPPSALRAFIMAVVFMLSLCLRKKYDALSSLSCACMALLLVSPLTLFSLSFIMSVCAVFGILLYCPPIYKFLAGEKPSRLVRFVSVSIALSVSANIFLLPICVNVFGQVSVYFILSNLFVLPLVVCAYSYIFVCALFCLISPALGILYYPADFVLYGIRIVSQAIAVLPMASVSVRGQVVLMAVYTLIMAIMSRYVMLSKYKKLSFGFALLVFGVIAAAIF
ncbi:MAG: ComEC/Rec2 family competence protein [Christensenellales bacterium]|jgi:competence protein ComEC|nr:ComEC/Rec2 family competence protein [Clostridiales bacterium]